MVNKLRISICPCVTHVSIKVNTYNFFNEEDICQKLHGNRWLSLFWSVKHTKGQVTDKFLSKKDKFQMVTLSSILSFAISGRNSTLSTNMVKIKNVMWSELN